MVENSLSVCHLCESHLFIFFLSVICLFHYNIIGIEFIYSAWDSELFGIVVDVFQEGQNLFRNRPPRVLVASSMCSAPVFVFPLCALTLMMYFLSFIPSLVLFCVLSPVFRFLHSLSKSAWYAAKPACRRSSCQLLCFLFYVVLFHVFFHFV